MSSRLTSGTVAGLTCIGVVGSFISLRFARSVFLDLIERSGWSTVDQSRLTVVALGATNQALLITVFVVSVSATVLAEVFLKTPDNRLTIHAIVLLVQILFLALALSGFFISFYIPDVRIP